jgi:hypothetical protein
MPVFRLEPVDGDTTNPRWETTNLREGCWVQAASEEFARKMVERLTVQNVASKPGGVLYTPWTDPSLTECRIDYPHIEVPDGIIVTVGGKTISRNEIAPRP